MDDRELLRRYATDGCAESFALIVRRDIGWVDSASLRQVGEALGVSEVAARKRVSRAVERLGAFFKRRGVVVPMALAVSLMLGRTASAAPAAGLVQAVVGAGGGAIGPVALTLVRGAVGRM